MANIHPTALVDPAARVAADARIGAYTIIGAGVAIGAETVVGPHVVVTGRTTIGRRNRIFQFASVGDIPQDRKYGGEPTKPHGTNNEGLRRRGFSSDDILEVRRAYKALYRENLTLEEAKAKIGAAAAAAPVLNPLVEFLAVPGRGIVR